MKDVIKKDVSSALSTVLKTRHSIAAQHFIKGAENYLMNFNNEIQGIVDVEKMKELHSKIIDLKTLEVDLKNKDLLEALKLGNKLLLSAVLVAGSLAFLYPRLKASFSKTVKSVKENLLVASLLQYNSPSDAFSKAIKFMGGYGEFVLKSINVLVGNLYLHVILPLLDTFLNFFDYFLFGLNYTVAYGLRQNVFVYIFELCAHQIFEIIDRKTGFLSLLEMWIDSVRRKILVRPKLVAYLKYGPHVQEKLKETSSTIAGVSNDWQEIRNTGIIFNDFQSVNVNNRLKWRTNKGTDTKFQETSDIDDKTGWTRLSNAVSEIFNLTFDEGGASFVKRYDETSFHSYLLNPLFYKQFSTYIENFLTIHIVTPIGTKLGLALKQSIYLEEDWFTTYIELQHWSYFGEEPGKILDDTKIMLDRLPFYLKHTLVYKSIVDEYNNMEKIRENESNFGWDLVQLYRNLYLNIIINVFQAQYDQSLQKWKMWGEYDGVNTELAWIFKDKLLTFVTNYRLKTIVLMLDLEMMVTNLSFLMYLSRLNEIFKLWSSGQLMFPSLKVLRLFDDLNYLRIVQILLYTNRLMSNAKVAIDSDKQGRFRKLSILNYNKRIGYGQSEKSLQEILFKSLEGKTLKLVCADIVKNFILARKILKSVRNRRIMLLQNTNAIVSKLTLGAKDTNLNKKKLRRKARKQKLQELINYALRINRQMDLIRDPIVMGGMLSTFKFSVDVGLEKINNL